jgi:hypothetical protein
LNITRSPSKATSRLLCNSEPVRVARQAGEHSVGSAIRPLGIDHPFGLSQWGKVGFESGRLGQGGLVGEEL